MDAAPSKTALSAAVARGRHRLEDQPPWVFDDPFALVLVGPIWQEIKKRSTARYRQAVGRELMGGIVVRSRYAEDRLAPCGHAQYVILGAGLDSFAWRRPDLLGSVRVFEVDHPASQAWKRQRAAALGLPASPAVVYVPIDFEVQTLHEGLAGAGFVWSQPAFFSWLGVTMYLTADAIEATLRTVTRCAPGSEIVFTYGRADVHLDEVGREFRGIVSSRVAEVGEPLRTRFSRAEVEAFVARCGLEVAEHPDREDLVARYFSNRTDGLKPYTAEGVIAARVPGCAAAGSAGGPS
jgi:methyltransferase (TIGR00027 family)